MKPPNILVTLLTSNNMNYLKETVKSILNQKNTTMQYGLVIVVNTLDDSYYRKVVKYFKYLQVIRTVSNGKPGKGHNSVLEFFKNNSQYDYIVPIDGDDFLYPYALTYIESYIKLSKPTDILLLMYTDSIKENKPSIPVPYMCVDNKGYLIWNFHHITHNQWFIDKGNNPFNNNVNTLNTPCRIVLMSRQSLQYNISFDEDCHLYDDFLPFMQIFEMIYTTPLSIIKTDFSGIMLYNCLVHDSATTKFSEKLWADENAIFKKSIHNKFNHILDWKLSDIPYLNVPPPDNYNFNVKCDFVKTLFNNLGLKDMIFNEEDLVSLYDWYEILSTEAKKINAKDIYSTYMSLLYNKNLTITT